VASAVGDRLVRIHAVTSRGAKRVGAKARATSRTAARCRQVELAIRTGGDPDDNQT
jgi:hypothetical protein